MSVRNYSSEILFMSFHLSCFCGRTFTSLLTAVHVYVHITHGNVELYIPLFCLSQWSMTFKLFLFKWKEVSDE